MSIQTQLTGLIPELRRRWLVTAAKEYAKLTVILHKSETASEARGCQMIVGNASRLAMELIPSKPGRNCVALPLQCRYYFDS